MKKNTRSSEPEAQPSIDIDHIAKLASLTLSPGKKKTFEKQLTDVLGYVSKLQELDTKNVEPIDHITGLVNVAREDNPAPSQTQEEALANAPKKYNGFFEVDAIFDEDE